MYGFENLDKTLFKLEEIVLTGKTIVFYKENNCQIGLDKEILILKEQIREYYEIIQEK